MGRCKRYKTCKYRASKYDPNHCDYALITGRIRGCDPDECDKYEKGERLRVPSEFGAQVGKGTKLDKDIDRKAFDDYGI